MTLAGCTSQLPPEGPPPTPTRAPLAPDPAPKRPESVVAYPKSAPLTVTFRHDSLANQFWWIDQASRFDSRLTRPEQRAAIEAKAPLSPRQRQVLDAYAKLRSAHGDPKDAPAEVPHLDALPPELSASERFAAPFLSSATLAEAMRALSLPPGDAALVQAAFQALGPRILKHHAATEDLAAVQKQFTELARSSGLQQFAGLVADFYGVREKLGEGLTVQLVSQPEGHLRATQIGPVLLIPITPSTARSAELQRELLGVVVHELSHFMASRVSAEVRRQVTEAMDGTLGLPNGRHPNIFDEATQTAIGNIVFTKRKFPGAYDPSGNFYAYEPDNDYPYAIDSYARALAPHLERLLPVPAGFSGPYLKAAIQEHAALFPPVVRHHTRILSVLASNRALGNAFNGLFPAQSRLRHVGDDVDAFLNATQTSNAPRFVVGETHWALKNRDKLSGFDPVVGEVLGALEPGSQGACIGARFDRKRGSWNFVLIGGADGLRRLLVTVHRGMTVPAGKPTCSL